MKKKQQSEDSKSSTEISVTAESIEKCMERVSEARQEAEGSLQELIDSLENEPKPYPASVYYSNEYGLKNGVNYAFNEDGTVNWRAMVRPEHLYPNKDRFPEGKVPDSIEGLEDSKLLIKLAGIKEVARLRGYKEVRSKVILSEPDRAVVSCKIKWAGNYESEFNDIIFEDVANATVDNCNSFATKFLECIAYNRAFIRCVRNFLNIHIVGEDEIDKSEKAPVDNTVAISPQDVLAKNARAKGFDDYESFKGFLRKLWMDDSYKNEDIKDWSSFKDIPAKESRILLALLNQYKQ